MHFQNLSTLKSYKIHDRMYLQYFVEHNDTFQINNYNSFENIVLNIVLYNAS